MAKQIIITPEEVRGFEKYMRLREYSSHTIESYSWAVSNFMSLYGGVMNQQNIIRYKESLLEHCKVSSTNLRLKALNCFLKYKNNRDIVIKYLKCQRMPFIEHVISNADYKYLKMRLRRDREYKWLYLIWFMGATGARISEVVRIKAENIYDGYVDMLCKGQKLRRIYIPVHLQKELLSWIEKEGISKGSFIWTNKNGQTLEIGGIERMCKVFAERYGLDPQDVYPHSFRHRFAMNFLEKSGNDVMLLADLLGHSNLETTRRYLMKTATQQKRLVNNIIDW